jgi:Tol biopolymer transport system component
MAMDSTAAGVVLGTVGYMAPEQVRGEPSDARSDLFALGVILHEMLSGNPPFARGSAIESMHAILSDDPAPLPATVPTAVARVAARCLEKQPSLRFQSARDLAFTLEALAGEGSRPDAEAITGHVAAAATKSRSAAPWLLAAFLIGAVAGFGVARLTAPAGGGSTIRVSALSHGTRDTEPAASADGRLVAFSAVRPSGQGIWVMDMATRGEIKLTDGPDNLPRFAPDGGSVLFTRAAGTHRSLWRVPVLGGSARLLLDNGTDADWSPDGSRIAFLRAWADSGGQHMQLLVSRSDGTEVREVLTLRSDILFAPRWSPEGGRVALIRAGNQNVANAVLVVNARDGTTREYPAPNRAVLSNACWEGNGDGLIVVEGEGLLALQRGSSGRLYRLDARSGAYRSLGWLDDYPPVFDLLPDGRLVLSSNAVRENITEIPADGSGQGRWLTHGMGIDRQPVYSPDGRWVMFSSNRGGTLDLWEVSVETGELRRITDDPADDWDPVYSRDGRSILWSSNRTSAFEIWTARRDGSAQRQVSLDSVDAENPSFGPDGRSVVYSSSHPGKPGIWRIPLEGGDGEHLLRAGTLLPELSPDGRHLAVIVGVGTLAANLEVFDLETRKLLPSSVPLPLLPGLSLPGRSRWTPDGRALVYVHIGADDRMRLLRRPLEAWRSGAPPETLAGGQDAESFGISPDARRIAVATVDWLSGLTVAEGVKGIVPPGRGKARRPN